MQIPDLKPSVTQYKINLKGTKEMLQIKQNTLENIFMMYPKIVLFGAGAVTDIMFEAYKDIAFERKVDYIIDNDLHKDGKTVKINDKEIKIISFARFSNLDYKDYTLIIMPVFMLDVVKQIDVLKVFDGVPTYIYPFLMNRRCNEKFSIRHTEKPQIPKTIHYCWFGGNPLHEKYKRNIESWRKHCPDYEIVEWNETNYDVKKNRFMYQAYEKNALAYVPDYARKDIIYNHGGIYLDTDVEVLQPLDDLLYNELFMCMDDIANINMGSGFGAAKGNALIKAFRDDYDGRMFVNESGEIIGKSCGNYETPLAVKYGYRPVNKCQMLHGGGIVFPREVLCPVSWIGMPDVFTKNTFTVHKFDDLLIDNKGKENAAVQRREIEALIERMAVGGAKN